MHLLVTHADRLGWKILQDQVESLCSCANYCKTIKLALATRALRGELADVCVAGFVLLNP